MDLIKVFTGQGSRVEFMSHSGPLVGATSALHLPEQVYISGVTVQITPTHCREEDKFNGLQILK